MQISPCLKLFRFLGILFLNKNSFLFSTNKNQTRLCFSSSNLLLSLLCFNYQELYIHAFLAMILSKEFYDQCGLSYKKVIDNLEIDLADIDDTDDATDVKAEKVLIAISSFSKSYLTPKEYWQHCFSYIEKSNKDAPDFDTYKKSFGDVFQLAYFCLYCDKKWNTLRFLRNDDYERYDDIFDEFTNFKPCANNFLEPYADNYLKLDHFHCFDRKWHTVMTERDLSYPHDMLKDCLRQLEIQTTKLPSTKLYKRYEEMLKLYPQIKAAEDDYEEWYQLLLQVGDNDYVKNNIEYRLGQDLHNVKLWKLYIEFLKENEEYKHLLAIYSKYCRFFLDDDEMKKEYEVAILKYGPINLPWENLFDFEVHNGLKEEDGTQHFDSEVKEKPQFDKKICAAFYKTRKRQNFSLSGPLVLYLLQNAGHRVLQKLFFSCKYFFAEHPTPICYHLQTGHKKYEDESLTLKRYSENESCPKNLFITGNLFAGTYHVPFVDFLPKLYRCEAKYIYLACPNLSFDELKFLVEHGGVIELDICSCSVKDENGQFIHMEKIMALLPNIERLSLWSFKTNANTGHALAELKFNSKISSIELRYILGVPFDVDEFLKFLTAIKDDEQKFYGYFCFNKDFDAAFVENLGQILYDYPISHQDDYIYAEFEED